MPDKPFEWVPKEDILSFEELFSVIKIAVDDGVNKIRITGGEPLLRHDLDRFIAMINAYNQDIDLALTTNGYLLKQYAKSLYDAGLKRVNISLDSLDPATMQKIAQKDVLDTVLEGVEEALAVGLQLKLNMVPLWGINDSEVLFMLEYCKKRAIVVRFIEYMHNTHAKDSLRGMRSKDILQLINKKYSIQDFGLKEGSPSHIYGLEDGYEFGIIEPHDDSFCKSCDRLRINAEGFLIPCLYFDEAQSIKEAIKQKDYVQTKKILKQVVADKPEKNRWSEDEQRSTRAFYETGG